jgi:hypothetical protein
MSSSSKSARVAPSSIADTASNLSEINSPRSVPLLPSISSPSNRNNSVVVATDDELDRLALQAFVHDILPQVKIFLSLSPVCIHHFSLFLFFFFFLLLLRPLR